MAPPCPRLMDDSLATQPPGGDSLLARKPSDTWSSESTVATEESGGCGNCIINFLHLRPHAVDAVVDDTTQAEDVNVCNSMMEEEDNTMIDASMSEEDNRDYDVNIDTKKPPPASCQDQGQVEEAASPRYYPSTPKDRMESKKPSATTPPPLNHRRRDNTSCLDIITNDPPSSTGSISVELHQQSSELSIPTLSRILPPESLPQSHLIRTTTNDDDNDDAPLLSLNSMSTIHANPNEAMMPPIPRIHLQMRQSSSNQTSSSSANRVRSEGHRTRHSATQQTVEETRQRQHTSGFVPIQQNAKQEGDDDDEEKR